MTTPIESHAVDEQPIDAARAILDPHHHLWDHGKVPGMASDPKPFLLPEFMRTIHDSGHNVVQSVYIECRSMYRREGPSDLRPVGETEFANGMAAMSASGRYGECQVAAIVGHANLRLGAEVAPILEAQIAAGNGRFRGVRFITAYAEPGLFGRGSDPRIKGLMLDATFREGVRALGRHDLSMDVWCLHPQLHEAAELAAVCPDVTFVLDHVGTPLKLDASEGSKAEVFPQWQAAMRELARRPNVFVKLGGLGMKLGAPLGTMGGKMPSTQLADAWRPYVETCIEAFGAQRAMFESNFPVDNATCSYGALWNAFKLITASSSEDDKSALFGGTARKVYRLG